MSVKIIIVTHDEIGQALIKVASTTLGQLPLETSVVKVGFDTDPEELLIQLQQRVEQNENKDGILILTDLYGSTPCNLAAKLQTNQVRVVAGLNLPMLIRLMNYPKLSLKKLAQKAVSGGKDGVLDCVDN